MIGFLIRATILAVTVYVVLVAMALLLVIIGLAPRFL